MSRGYVYVLTNASMPGLVKVGMTTRTPEVRARELSGATNMPTPFEVFYSAAVSDCAAVEAIVHRALGAHRVRAGREFFRVPPRRAARIVARETRRYHVRPAARWPFAVPAAGAAGAAALLGGADAAAALAAALEGLPPGRLALLAGAAAVLLAAALARPGRRRRRPRR